MFSAFRKRFGKEDEGAADGVNGKRPDTPRSGPGGASPGIHHMEAALQRRFARGVQYNMKIIIRGDRNTGKTSLFQRLKGQIFSEEYAPTEEIQVGSINWSYKTTDDVVKVEVWDVVDRGKRKKKSTGLKIANAPSLPEDAEEAVLDAEWVDVYKGTHGVVIVTDITKSWTVDYVKKELPKIPPRIPVLILANFRDLGNSRAVMKSDYECLVEEASLQRGSDAAEVRFAESSMKTAFGLKFLHRFFNVPFLSLQRESLQRQMETNAREMSITRRELDALMDSEEQNYELFCQNLKQRKASVDGTPQRTPTTPTRGGFPADGVFNSVASTPLAPSPSPASVRLPPLQPTPTSDFKVKRKSVDEGVETKPPCPQLDLCLEEGMTKPPTPRALTPTLHPSASRGQIDYRGSTPRTDSPSSSPAPLAINSSSFSGAFSDASATAGYDPAKASPSDTPKKRSSKSSSPAVNELPPSSASIIPDMTAKNLSSGGILSVDDFVLEDGIENSFLDDVGNSEAGTSTTLKDPDSDSDEDANPMVAAFQEDINPEDLKLKPAVLSPRLIVDSRASEDDDEEDPQIKRISARLKNLDFPDTTNFNLPSRSRTLPSGASSIPSVSPPSPSHEVSAAEIRTVAPVERVDHDDDALQSWLDEETPATTSTVFGANEEVHSDDAESRALEIEQSQTATPHASSTNSVLPPPLITSLTLDDFHFLETQSGVSSVDGDRDAGKKVGNMASTAMLTPSSSVCDISESSERSADTKKKSKKKKKETEDEDHQQKAHKKKKKHKDKDLKEDDESGGKKKHKSSKKVFKKHSKEEQQAMEFLGASAGGSGVGGEYESI